MQNSNSLLIKLAEDRFNNSSINNTTFIKDVEGDKLIKNITKYPHLFVSACVMDKQIKAERAWSIPIKLGRTKYVGGFEFSCFEKLSEEKYIELFSKLKLHRHNLKEAKNFYSAIQKIKYKYNSNASNIWKGNLSSAEIVLRFLDFEGIGIKIATMATNILVRDFKIKVSDTYSIDISPDVHIKKIFYRKGLIDDRNNIDKVIYTARSLYPEFPGILDLLLWEIGRDYCFETNPNCKDCPISSECKKLHI